MDSDEWQYDYAHDYESIPQSTIHPRLAPAYDPDLLWVPGSPGDGSSENAEEGDADDVPLALMQVEAPPAYERYERPTPRYALIDLESSS